MELHGEFIDSADCHREPPGLKKNTPYLRVDAVVNVFEIQTGNPRHKKVLPVVKLHQRPDPAVTAAMIR